MVAHSHISEPFSEIDSAVDSTLKMSADACHRVTLASIQLPSQFYRYMMESIFALIRKVFLLHCLTTDWMWEFFQTAVCVSAYFQPPRYRLLWRSLLFEHDSVSGFVLHSKGAKWRL